VHLAPLRVVGLVMVMLLLLLLQQLLLLRLVRLGRRLLFGGRPYPRRARPHTTATAAACAQPPRRRGMQLLHPRKSRLHSAWSAVRHNSGASGCCCAACARRRCCHFLRGRCQECCRCRHRKGVALLRRPASEAHMSASLPIQLLTGPGVYIYIYIYIPPCVQRERCGRGAQRAKESGGRSAPRARSAPPAPLYAIRRL
jgi:hypothetical protein